MPASQFAQPPCRHLHRLIYLNLHSLIVKGGLTQVWQYYPLLEGIDTPARVRAIPMYNLLPHPSALVAIPLSGGSTRVG